MVEIDAWRRLAHGAHFDAFGERMGGACVPNPVRRGLAGPFSKARMVVSNGIGRVAEEPAHDLPQVQRRGASSLAVQAAYHGRGKFPALSESLRYLPPGSSALHGRFYGKRCSCDVAGLGEIMLAAQQQVSEVTRMCRPVRLATQSRPSPLAQGVSI